MQSHTYTVYTQRLAPAAASFSSGKAWVKTNISTGSDEIAFKYSGKHCARSRPVNGVWTSTDKPGPSEYVRACLTTNRDVAGFLCKLMAPNWGTCWVSTALLVDEPDSFPSLAASVCISRVSACYTSKNGPRTPTRVRTSSQNTQGFWQYLHCMFQPNVALVCPAYLHKISFWHLQLASFWSACLVVSPKTARGLLKHRTHFTKRHRAQDLSSAHCTWPLGHGCVMFAPIWKAKHWTNVHFQQPRLQVSIDLVPEDRIRPRNPATWGTIWPHDRMLGIPAKMSKP